MGLKPTEPDHQLCRGPNAEYRDCDLNLRVAYCDAKLYVPGSYFSEISCGEREFMGIQGVCHCVEMTNQLL